MNERWKEIEGFKGYEVSNLGRVRSWHKGRWGRRAEPRILTPGDSNGDYQHVSLIGSCGSKKTRGVHQLVTEAFYGPRPSGSRIVFLDGDRRNNQVTNLVYRGMK